MPKDGKPGKHVAKKELASVQSATGQTVGDAPLSDGGKNLGERTNYERAQEHGVEAVVWNNFGHGWQLTCLCGWVSAADSMMAEVGVEFDAHLSDLGIEV